MVDRIRTVVEELLNEGPWPVPDKPVINKPVIYTLPCRYIYNAAKIGIYRKNVPVRFGFNRSPECGTQTRRLFLW